MGDCDTSPTPEKVALDKRNEIHPTEEKEAQVRADEKSATEAPSLADKVASFVASTGVTLLTAGIVSGIVSRL